MPFSFKKKDIWLLIQDKKKQNKMRYRDLFMYLPVSFWNMSSE